MQKSIKDFAQRLNQCLDDTGAPPQTRERASILGKVLEIPKHQAFSLLEGHQLPELSLLQKIAQEFEVDANWLCGEK